MLRRTSDRRQYAKTVEALSNHAKKTLKYAEDLAPLFAEDISAPTIAMPEDPGEDQGRLTEAIKEYHAARIRALRSKHGYHSRHHLPPKTTAYGSYNRSSQ